MPLHKHFFRGKSRPGTLRWPGSARPPMRLPETTLIQRIAVGSPENRMPR